MPVQNDTCFSSEGQSKTVFQSVLFEYYGQFITHCSYSWGAALIRVFFIVCFPSYFVFKHSFSSRQSLGSVLPSIDEIKNHTYTPHCVD